MVKDENPGFVTRAECETLCGGLKDDFKSIKKALIGDDLKGGLVLEFRELKNTVTSLVDNQTREDNEGKARRESFVRYKAALIGVTGGLVGVVLGYLLCQI